LPLALLAGVIAQGALFRRAFGARSGLKGLRWGRDEWRLLAAQLMILACCSLIGSRPDGRGRRVAMGVARTAPPASIPARSPPGRTPSPAPVRPASSWSWRRWPAWRS
jgi:hypothetical protein